jgi:hypothetical protein
MGVDRGLRSGKVGLLAICHSGSDVMSVDHQPTQAANRTDLGAVFVSLEHVVARVVRVDGLG